MTTVTWKEGGPLFLQPAPGSESGLVAIDGDCCCPPPPPDRCWCGSYCSYFIELVEPSAIAVRSRVFDCGNPNDNQSSVQTDSLLQAIVPVYEESGEFYFPPGYSVATASSSDFTSPLSVTVRDEIAGFPTFLPPELYYFQLNAFRRASITISCVTEIEGPKFYATLLVSAAASYRFESLGFTPLGTWARLYRGTFEIPASCVVSPERECFSSGQEFLRITTPLEITLGGDGTSSLGNLSLEADGNPNSSGLPPEFPYARDAVDAILDATNYTFRITSRPNCAPPVGCNCGQSLAGIQLQFFGELFTVGNEPDDIRAADSRRWVYTDSATSPNITYEVFNESFTETYYLASATISCSPSEDPETVPDKWLLTVSATCFTWDDDGNGGREIVEQTTKTWVGEYECTEHCEVSLPYGVPLQLVLVSTVTPPGLGACDPGSSGPPVEIQFAPCE